MVRAIAFRLKSARTLRVARAMLPHLALRVLLMRLVKYCFLWLAFWLGIGAAGAQCALPNPPGGCTFVAIDVASGLTINAFCVGRQVRFEPCASRAVDASPPVYYGVLTGIGTTFVGCTPPLANTQSTYRYTPQPADVGMVTVSELANERGVAKYYVRTFQVYATPNPVFTVFACPTGAALVTLTDAVYDTYTVQAGTGPILPILRNQALVLPLGGATAITVTGHYSANGTCEKAATQPATLAPPQAPLFTSLTLQAALPTGPATLAVSGLPAGYRYTLQVDPASGGGFRDVLAVPPGSTSLTLPSPVTAGCYRIFRNDYCGTSPAFSPAICTLSLTGASALNRNQLLLSDAGRPGTTYTVTRDGSPLTGFTAISGGLEDPNVQCGTTYTYVVTATQPGGGQSISNPVSILTQSAIPPAAPRLLASFNLNDVVELTPLLPTGSSLTAGSSLRYRRAAGGAAPADFRTATTLRVQRDSAALAELRAHPPCYSIRLTDVCGNTSPEGPATCPALLTAAAADPSGSTVALTWTPFTGPDPNQPATYTVQRLAADGTVLGNVPVSGTSFTDLTPPTDRQVVRYRLQVGGAGLPAGTFSYSNRASISRQLSLAIPTAFTPNGDGLNDVLEVKGKYLAKYTFVVIDRNGQEVFRGTQRNETWDGRIRGHAPVLGAYVWRFQQDDEMGRPFTAAGTVTIVQ